MRWSIVLSLIIGLGAAAFMVTTEAPIEDPIWWYANNTPPRLTIQGPPGPVRGIADASTLVEPADRAHLVSAEIDGAPIAISGSRISVDSRALPDGVHTVRAVARDTSRQANETSAEWRFVSDNRGPVIDVSIDPAGGPTEGMTTEIRIRADEAVARVEGDLEGRPLRFAADGANGYWALAGIPPDPAYRSMKLRINAADPLGNESSLERSWPLVRTRFPTENLDFDPSIDNLANPQVRALEDARLMPIYGDSTAPKRWEGPFELPVNGPVTTDFATRRSYNGRFPEGNHAGTDFGEPLGASVRAPAAGTVAFADRVEVRGNVLILNHGAGVYSTYAHLQGFVAAVGQTVRTGDVIARVGSSGLSTGPHLHWEIWVNSANVDPLSWTRRTYP